MDPVTVVVAIGALLLLRGVPGPARSSGTTTPPNPGAGADGSTGGRNGNDVSPVGAVGGFFDNVFHGVWNDVQGTRTGQAAAAVGAGYVAEAQQAASFVASGVEAAVTEGDREAAAFVSLFVPWSQPSQSTNPTHERRPR